MARYAAVDIGSNSLRMLAADVLPGQMPQILAEDREVTRLGSSVFATGKISDQATESVCSVLRRMASAYHKLDVLAVRAVATSAVRDASNRLEFLERASEALGSPVEIISGEEEARLICLGVQSRWPNLEDRVLILDVGGGSAEFITLVNGDLKDGISRPLGAVRLTEMFLRRDPPSRLDLHRMESFIDEKLEPVVTRVQSTRFDRMIGTAATAASITSAIQRIPRSERHAIDRRRVTAAEVAGLYHELATRPLAERRKTAGIGPRRAEIIVGGAAVFWRVMELLQQDVMYYSSAGVRDGIVVDLAARGVGREVTRMTSQQLRVVEAMCRKYNVDVGYARQVARFTSDLFDALEPAHRLAPEFGRLVQTAAWLHDVGHFISGAGHHKHSAYIVANSDLPGYTDRERHLVSLLCRYHRKTLPQPRHEPFRDLNNDERRVVTTMTPLLRLAVALDTSKAQRVQSLECRLQNGGAVLRVRSQSDVDLELWATERAADIFRDVYGIEMIVEKSQ